MISYNREMGIETVAKQLRHHQTQWQEQGVDARIETLQAFKQSLQKHESSLLEAMHNDCHRIAISKLEIMLLHQRIDYWCEQAKTLCIPPPPGTSALQPAIEYDFVYHPYPLVGCISPWNYPVTLSFADTLPALLAGCAVMLKASEFTERFLTPLASAIADTPHLGGVFGIVRGGSETGIALIDQVDLICFTGSIATGKKVGVQAASRLIPAFLELGGKDPVIVLEDVDVAQAASIILRASCAGSGQACQSIERVYVHKDIYQALAAELAHQAKSIKTTAEDSSEGVHVPFIHTPQVDIVHQQVEDALAKGAKKITGGTRIEQDGKHWYPITVLTDVDHTMSIMQEETFGPVIPLMPFIDDAEAISLANDSIYGLSASVLGGTKDRAMAIARQIKAGAVSIHDSGLTTTLYDVEKNSFAQSGLGASRMGATGLLRFFRIQSLLYQTGQPAPLSVFKNGTLNSTL